MVKIALFGANGRLGKNICSLGSTLFSSFEILPFTRTGPSFLGDAEICLDVSLAEAFPLPLDAAWEHKKPIVIGVTGLSADQRHLIQKKAEEIPIFYSANFSVGMALFQYLALEIAKRFKGTIHLFETHHHQKKDSPSGSALVIRDLLQTIGKTASVTSTRKDQIIGEHTLLFTNDQESLELSHTVHTREAFAKGALNAVQFLLGKPAGLYDMNDLLRETLPLHDSLGLSDDSTSFYP